MNTPVKFNFDSVFVPQEEETEYGVPGLLADEKVEDTTETVSELKLQVESLVTAVLLSSSKPHEILANTMLDGSDALEMSHRIMTKMKVLRDENKKLYKQATGTSNAMLEASVAALEKENQQLAEELAKGSF